MHKSGRKGILKSRNIQTGNEDSLSIEKERFTVQEQKLGLRGSEIALVCPAKMGGVWEEAVQQAVEELTGIFGDLVTDVQEVGAGAVHSDVVRVYCKPIIDLAVAVRSIPEAREKLPAMRAAGYLHRFKRDNENRMFFIKRTESGEHTHHIYVLQAGCALWDDLIRFRDYLSVHPEKLKKYMIIKQDLANIPTTEIYITGVERNLCTM